MNKFTISLLALLALSASAYGQVNTTDVKIQTGPSSGQRTTVRTALPITRHFTVSAANIASIGAATSGNFPLITIPANSVITRVLVKHSTAVAGTGITASTARVVDSATNSYGGSALNVMQAVGDAALVFDGSPKMGSFSSPTVVNLAMTSSTGNLSAVTAGAVEVWVTYSVNTL